MLQEQIGQIVLLHASWLLQHLSVHIWGGHSHHVGVFPRLHCIPADMVHLAHVQAGPGCGKGLHAHVAGTTGHVHEDIHEDEVHGLVNNNFSSQWQLQ